MRWSRFAKSQVLEILQVVEPGRIAKEFLNLSPNFDQRSQARISVELRSDL